MSADNDIAIVNALQTLVNLGGWVAFIVSSSPNSYNEFVIRGLNAGFRF